MKTYLLAALLGSGFLGCTKTYHLASLPANPPNFTPTATPTPIPCRIWNFEDGTTQGWSVPYWNPVCSSTAVTALSSLGAAVSLGSFGLDIILPPAGCSVGVNDVQAQVSGGACPGFPIDFAALNLTGVRCRLWANPDLFSLSASEVVNACPYIQVPGPIYGGCFNGWPSQNPQPIPSPGGQWITVSLTPSGGSWATDRTNVIAIGLEVNENSANQPSVADVVVDNIQLF